mmetsp:Transcript_44442/g.69489  ORF Transcript_44442/g.69489 Transcript_44442/m.69489 type:complete len:177 (-) Transcript_44442:91-621(-)
MAKFSAQHFDAWGWTSINFAKEVARELGQCQIPLRITIPILRSHEHNLWSNLSEANQTVDIMPFPEEIAGAQGDNLAKVFALWGKRPPTRMLVGPQGEAIGPFMPSREVENFWEPDPGRLAVGPPAPSWWLETRQKMEEAHRQRILGYAVVLDALESKAGTQWFKGEVSRQNDPTT